uniref:Uncharacterized protein n=1 Tax=Anguilla anguilla TaxID=7936 RepID=A0A0E9W9H3_ANGAN
MPFKNNSVVMKTRIYSVPNVVGFSSRPFVNRMVIIS